MYEGGKEGKVQHQLRRSVSFGAAGSTPVRVYELLLTPASIAARLSSMPNWDTSSDEEVEEEEEVPEPEMTEVEQEVQMGREEEREEEEAEGGWAMTARAEYADDSTYTLQSCTTAAIGTTHVGCKDSAKPRWLSVDVALTSAPLEQQQQQQQQQQQEEVRVLSYLWPIFATT